MCTHERGVRIASPETRQKSAPCPCTLCLRNNELGRQRQRAHDVLAGGDPLAQPAAERQQPLRELVQQVPGLEPAAGLEQPLRAAAAWRAEAPPTQLEVASGPVLGRQADRLLHQHARTNPGYTKGTSDGDHTVARYIKLFSFR